MIFFLAYFPVRSDDVYMHLAIGRRFSREGGFPAVDPFIYSLVDYHWHIMREWGVCLLFYRLFALGGWNALVIMKTLCIMVTASIPLLMGWRLRYRSPLTGLLILLAGYAASSRFIERASLFSDLFTPLVLAIVLLESRRSTRFSYILPPCFALWVNLHPGFHVGLVIVAICAVFVLPRWKDRYVRSFSSVRGYRP